MAARLSVNLNKVATVRNSRGGVEPRVVQAAQVCIDAGAQGITVHMREDQRHIRRSDVWDLARLLEPLRQHVEYNIEGDPRPELVDLVLEVQPHQATLVPVRPGELTSQAGWPPDTPTAELRRVIDALRDAAIRVSLFVDPQPDPIRWAADLGADRIELFTEPYARAFVQGGKSVENSFELYRAAAELGHELGLGINAGHDLDLENLVLFRELPHLAEVSIGHAIISAALFRGLGPTVQAYLDVLSGVAP